MGEPAPSPRSAIINPMHRTTEQLEAQLPEILAAPKDAGPIEMIVRRPDDAQREIVQSARLDPSVGLVGDNWIDRGGTNAETQLTLMSSRVVDAMSNDRKQWPLAGDQIYVDMDLSKDNLPSGTQLEIGEATIQISEAPHTGCAKFVQRFGKDALRFANVGDGREKRFRGVYAFVVEPGEVKTGDKVTKLK